MRKYLKKPAVSFIVAGCSLRLSSSSQWLNGIWFNSTSSSFFFEIPTFKTRSFFSCKRLRANVRCKHIDGFYAFSNSQLIENLFCGMGFSFDTVVFSCLSKPVDLLIGARRLLEISIWALEILHLCCCDIVCYPGRPLFRGSDLGFAWFHHNFGINLFFCPLVRGRSLPESEIREIQHRSLGGSMPVLYPLLDLWPVYTFTRQHLSTDLVRQPLHFRRNDTHRRFILESLLPLWHRFDVCF